MPKLRRRQLDFSQEKERARNDEVNRCLGSAADEGRIWQIQPRDRNDIDWP